MDIACLILITICLILVIAILILHSAYQFYKNQAAEYLRLYEHSHDKSTELKYRLADKDATIYNLKKQLNKQVEDA